MPAALVATPSNDIAVPLASTCLIVLHEAPRGLFRIELEVVPADDILGLPADELRGRVVDEHVAAVEILDEDRVRRRADHRLQDVGAVRDGHRV